MAVVSNYQPYTPLANPGAGVNPTKDSAMGKEDFLKLFITELTNQDPMEPVSNKETIVQLSQFTMTEQMVNMSNSFQDYVDFSTNRLSGGALSLVDKTVEANASSVLKIDGMVPPVEYDIPKDADLFVTAYVFDDTTGELISTSVKGAQQAGSHQIYTWNGNNQSGAEMKDGSYRVIVTGENEQGQAYTLSQSQVGKVKSVRFAGNDVFVELDDGSVIREKDIISVSGGQS